jgi:adenine-specific DNA-methyltransferase
VLVYEEHMAEKDYSELNKEELIKIVEKIESRKKYGLIWDEEKVKEQFEKDAENALPVIGEIKGKEIVDKDESKPINILIEGDNYHALSVLSFTHQDKIDVIYIDPPYNTGNKDFKYNDSYVDDEDTYRHSKWLSFMSKRLKLAKGLLSKNGIIFISIDDNEHAQLRLLCNEIFDERNFVGTITWEKRTKAQNTETAKEMFQSKTEYILVYKKDTDKIRFKLEVGGEKVYDLEDEKGLYRLKLIEEMSALGMRGRETMVFSIEGIKPRRGYQWKIGKEQVEKYKAKNLIQIIDGRPYIKIRPEEETNQKFLPFWSHFFDKDTYGTSERGKSELTRILGSNEHEFETVKPINLIKKLLFHINNNNSVILDFFAGSGTTGHAVLEMNKQDGGNRQFILCTNNENDIITDICYPRIKKAITGYKNKDEKIPGLGSSLKYFKTKFVKKTANIDDLKIRMTEECTEMLCLRENVFDEIKNTGEYRIFQHGKKIVAICYVFERGEQKELKKDLDKLDGEKILYCFTLDPLGVNMKYFSGWNDIKIEPIPQNILDVYKQIYEY